MNAFSQVKPKRSSFPRLDFRPKVDKIVEMLVLLASTGRRFDQYQVVKLFYLADKEHFNRYGRPITFETYYAFDYGPVASTALDLIKGDRATLMKTKLNRLPIEVGRRGKLFVLGTALREFNRDMFSRSDLMVIGETIEEYGGKSFDELYKLTHSHFAYEIAWTTKEEGSKRALMFYEDMLDDGPRKMTLIEDLESVAPNLR